MSGLQSSQAQEPGGSTEATTKADQSAWDEARKRAKSRLKLRMAQAVAAVLGVLILLVVGLMVYLAFSKYTDRQREQAAQIGGTTLAQKTSQQAGAKGAQSPAQGLVGPDCRLASSALDGGRLVLIFEGEAANCQRLIILNTNTGALVVDRALIQAQPQE